MTPNDIEVLLHCHVVPAPHPRASAPGVQQALDYWRSQGCIELTSPPDVMPAQAREYGTTAKGKAMVKALCNTPLPRCVWVDKEGKELL